MKFSTREDIAGSVDQVFAAVTDFDLFERAILRRGAEVSRTDRLTRPGVGMSWKTRMRYRGKMRELTAEMVRYERPELLSVLSQSSGFDGTLHVELLQLSPRQTRLMIELDIKPRTMAARLFLQSLRLAKANLTRRFKQEIHGFARRVEMRLNETAPRA